VSAPPITSQQPCGVNTPAPCFVKVVLWRGDIEQTTTHAVVVIRKGPNMQWEGKAIFARAFRTLLPDKDSEKRDTTASSLYTKTFEQGKAPRHRVSTPRGANFAYVAGPSKYYGRAGTWTYYMVQAILTHTTTRDANQAHAASGQYLEKRLDFNWMLQHQYITRV
jgi:hypothetical protein